MDDRLSALDQAFLALDGARRPLHVGFTLRFAGPPPSLGALRAHLDARLGLVPRFRGRLAAGPLGLGGVRWADDEAFAIGHHVHAVALPAPGGEAELRAAAGVLLAAPLDPARPLWRVTLVTGLAEDEWAVVGQAHHALVDGVAAVEVAVLLFGPEAQDAAAAWRPAPARALGRQVREAGGAGAGTARALTRALREAGADARRAPAALGAAAAAVEALGRGRGARDPLRREVTDRRAIAFADVPLPGLKEAGRRHGATLNDVLLAASGLALGRAFGRRGAAPAPEELLRALVPVSVRDPEGAGALGNRLSFLAVDLPVGLGDPVEALRAVRDATHEAKAQELAGPVGTAAAAADVLPGAVRGALARAAYDAAGFSLVISNVPGPPVTLSLLGRELRAIHPMVPVPPGRGLSIGAITYGGALRVGLACDRAVVPDAARLAADLAAGLEALRDAAGSAPTAWRARARSRRTAADPARPLTPA